MTAKYLGDQLSIQNTDFKSGQSSDVLVIRHGGDEEFILQGVFQIACNEFFFTLDRSFNPLNMLNSHFQDVKLSCCLTCPAPKTFPFTVMDFSKCIDNLCNLEKVIKIKKKDQIMSTLTGSILGSMQIKLSHVLFEVRFLVDTIDLQ